MVINLNKKKQSLIFQTCPKNACSTFKNIGYLINNGQDFNPYIKNGNMIWIHDIYPCKRQSLDSEKWNKIKSIKIFLWRDPVSRFISAYNDRVLHEKDLEKDKHFFEKAKKDNLNILPSVEEFVKGFDFYNQCPSINHHFELQKTFYGTSKHKYDYVFRFDNLNPVFDFLEEFSGKKLGYRHDKKGPEYGIYKNSLNSSIISWIEKKYKQDYQIYKEN